MGFRKKILQKVILLLLNLITFYYAFWIFWDIGFHNPWQLIIMANMFNIMMIIVCIILQVFLSLAFESPEFRHWLLTIERSSPKKSRTKRKKQKTPFF